ncbi:hypothetical protein Dda_7713 [Drechslerella dactyloides]|uniref:Uncharacterized protein n=1 Tax=Drechslerella dactyloides TaxID=74499 RepID=A0AAD6ISV8_DREDA|nr:hypothetical protein Dda_7713 [Drechslerella dactyloides]
MQPPGTPRYRFTSPDDARRPPKLPTGATPAPAAVAQPQFATPAPLTARRQLDVNIDATARRTPATVDRRQKGYNRGFSPDPDLYLSTPRVASTTAPTGLSLTQNKNKRRRSFDLDEIDEALMTSGRPKILGPSSSGWKVGEFLTATPVPGKGKGRGAQALGSAATPTPATRQQPPLLFQRASTILSSPPENLELSFGDTQEDVQDDSEEGNGVEGGEVGVTRRQRKRRKSRGAFDDIESIASSLPTGLLGDDDGDEDEVSGSSDAGDEAEDDRQRHHRAKGKENATPRVTTAAEPTMRNEPPLTPPRFRTAIDAREGTIATTTTTTTKQWIKVPNQPQLNLPPQNRSPSAKKLDQAICAMAWSPSHRRRRNANAKYLTGGLASTVLGWAYDAQDSVLRSNAAIEQQQQGLHVATGRGVPAGVFVVAVEALWEEENYVAAIGAAEPVRWEQQQQVGQEKQKGEEARVVLVGDANSAMRRELGAGSRVEVRPPTWEVEAGGRTWTVVVNWKAHV